MCHAMVAGRVIYRVQEGADENSKYTGEQTSPGACVTHYLLYRPILFRRNLILFL